MITRLIKIAFIVFLLLGICSGPVCARKLVVVVANRLTLADISGYSTANISNSMAFGAVGLISPNCSGPKSEASVLLTAASGNPAMADIWIRDIRTAEEKTPTAINAAADYKLRTGNTAKPGSGVFLQLATAVKLNTLSDRPFKTGLIGDSMQAAGKRVCVLGSADVESEITPAIPDRSAAVIAADSQGLIDRFDPFVSGTPAGKTNWLSDPDALAASAVKALQENDLVVLCFGDLVRLDNMRSHMNARSFDEWKTRALRRLDVMASYLMEECQKQDATLVLVSFGLPDLMVKNPKYPKTWEELTPVMVWGNGSGLLMSPSTRTSGLITAADFAPTILQMTGTTPVRRVTGRPSMTMDSGQSSMDYLQRKMVELQDLNARVRVNRILLDPMGGACAGLAAVAFCSLAVVVAFGLKISKKLRSVMWIGMISVISLPAALMIAAVFPPGIYWYVGGTVISAAALTALALYMASKCESYPGSAPAFICAYTALIIIADAFTGSPLCRISMPSSYQLSGMRYYGTGNEFASFAIAMAGCTMLFLGSAIPNLRSLLWKITAGLGTVLIIALGWGSFGANYGATAAATTTFILLAIALGKGSIRLWHVVLSIFAGVVVSFALSEIDAHIMGGMSTHAGRAARVAGTDGTRFLLEMMIRKIGFNLKTVFGSTACLIFLGFTPFLFVWFHKIQGKANQMLASIPGVRSGYIAMLIGSGVAFILNDSGIVMAAIMLGIMLSMLLCSLFELEATECHE
jgi:hypothetical protein